MKRWLSVIVVLTVLAVFGYQWSGRGRMAGVLVDEDGTPASGCAIDRDLRLGWGFSRGFDTIQFVTRSDGRFDLAVDRGINRLTFDCPDGKDAAVTGVVWRNYQPDIRAVRG